MNDLTCIERPIEALPGKPWTGRTGAACTGQTHLRPSLSGTGTAIPRCDGHWELRQEKQRDLNRRYPIHAPADFDPLFAGERWDENDS